ncbi:MAG: ECF transporter S component [Clostridia bacterium]|nr:ECF transporter S component [Clostridia bacterium]
MKNSKEKIKRLVLLALFSALLIVMSYTPLGYLNIGPLAITFNVIPVALAAATLGPSGGAFVGAVFGITSFLQCLGIGGTSAMGVILFDISPLLTFVQRFFPRVLEGLLAGFIFKGMKKLTNNAVSCAVTGFATAFLNTALFMTTLILLFGNTDYIKDMVGGQNIIVFICSFVGINAVFEIISATLLTGGIGAALYKAKVVPQRIQKSGGKAK